MPIPLPVHIRAPQEVAETSPGTIKPEQHPAFKWGIAATLVIFTLLIGVAGYFGWKLLKPSPAPTTATPPKTNPPPAPVATTPAPTANPAPAQSPQPPENAEPAPGATTPQPAETALNNSAPSTPETKPEPAGPPALSPVSSPVTTTVGPDVTAKTGVPMAVSNASPAFRSFIANAKITGVFQGRNPRAVINGRVTRIGDTVDHSLGIVFHDIDAVRKQVVFKDASGAIVTRRY